TTVEAWVTSQGQQLTRTLLGGVMGHLSPSRVDADYGSCAGVLVCLTQVPGATLREWVQAALTGTGTAGLFAVLDATGRVAPEDKAAFVQNLVTAADEAAFRRAVRQFSKLCRQRAVVV
ncbi:hypothetical protein DYB26_014174, partial [Aphanomyces astaci]